MSTEHKIPKRKKREENKEQNQANIPNINNNLPVSNPLASNQNISNPLQNPQMNFTNKNYNTNQVNAFNPFAIQESQRIKLERRMRYRHRMDGAVNIQIEDDDLQNDRYELYENQDINFEKPKINENISKENTDYYIESIHHNRYIKIEKQKEKTEEIKPPEAAPGQISQIEEPKPQKEILKAKKHKKPLTAYEIGKITEKKMFEKFENELSEVIDKTISKVTIIFLFTSALLSGMGLLNMVYLTTYEDFESFRDNYANSVMLIYILFHALTFASLVGNGIKFIMSYKRYDVMASRFNKSSISVFTDLRRKMIFSGVLLCLFTITFILEIYIGTLIQLFNYIKCPEEGEVFIHKFDKSDFNKFRGVHIVVDIFVLIIFILNIFDINVSGEKVERIITPKVEVNYYLNEDDESENLLR
jgi:hypothetical protein